MDWQNFVGFSVPMGGEVVAGALLFVLMVWSVIWKGLALWKAAHQESKGWFIALLILNTVGILDILYLYVFSKKSTTSVPPPQM